MTEDSMGETASCLLRTSKKRTDSSDFESTAAGSEEGYSSVQASDLEEASPLLQTWCCQDVPLWADEIVRNIHAALDVFKGVLVVFMTLAHTNLTLMSPSEQYVGVPHAIGNIAASVCFLGFLLAYGFSCDCSYFSELKARSPIERFWRVLRSAALPIVGAWVCAFGWCWMYFKLPLDIWTLFYLLNFRITVGNGPDFLLCFTVALLVTYPFRQTLNIAFSRERPLMTRVAFAALMLLLPLKLSQMVVEDCTGLRKYYGYFLECNKRDAFAPVLPALPHLFYFNLGILLSRGVSAFDAALKSGYKPDKGMLVSSSLLFATLSLILSYPLMTVWSSNYGNVSVSTSWGMVTRGFADGPSVLWLLGNIAPVAFTLTMSIVIHCVATFYTAESSFVHWLLLRLLQHLRDELAHLGSNVLLYLVVADVCLAGLYRGPKEQTLRLSGCTLTMLGILAITRFICYLSASSRVSR